MAKMGETYLLKRPGGGDLHVRRRLAEGPSVVFVHGFCGGGDLFSHLFSTTELAGYDLITFDLLGHGRSSASSGLVSDTDLTWFEDLSLVLDEVGGKPKVLVGWSMGTIGIAEYLTRARGGGSVSGVNLIAPAFSVGNEKAKHRSGARFSSAVSGLLSSDPARQRVGLVEFAEEVMGDVDPQACAAAIGVAALSDLAARRRLITTSVDYDEFYQSIEEPLLVSIGNNDPVIDSESTRQLMTGTRAKLSIYEGVGHAVHFAQSGRFVSELVGFLEDLGL